MTEDDVEHLLADAELVACLQAPLPEAKELRDACLAADIPALLSRGSCCGGGGGCGCAPKLALYARPEDAPHIARLMQDRWQQLRRREGSVASESALAAANAADEAPCPACGTAAPLDKGACSDCGLQLE